MIVCLCEGVSDRQIKGVIESGAQSVEQVGEICGAGISCGACVFAIQQMLEQEIDPYFCASDRCSKIV